MSVISKLRIRNHSTVSRALNQKLPIRFRGRTRTTIPELYEWRTKGQNRPYEPEIDCVKGPGGNMMRCATFQRHQISSLPPVGHFRQVQRTELSSLQAIEKELKFEHETIRSLDSNFDSPASKDWLSRAIFELEMLHSVCPLPESSPELSNRSRLARLLGKHGNIKDAHHPIPAETTFAMFCVCILVLVFKNRSPPDTSRKGVLSFYCDILDKNSSNKDARFSNLQMIHDKFRLVSRLAVLGISVGREELPFFQFSSARTSYDDNRMISKCNEPLNRLATISSEINFVALTTNELGKLDSALKEVNCVKDEYKNRVVQRNMAPFQNYTTLRFSMWGTLLSQINLVAGNARSIRSMYLERIPRH